MNNAMIYKDNLYASKRYKSPTKCYAVAVQLTDQIGKQANGWRKRQ